MKVSLSLLSNERFWKGLTLEKSYTEGLSLDIPHSSSLTSLTDWWIHRQKTLARSDLSANSWHFQSKTGKMPNGLKFKMRNIELLTTARHLLNEQIERKHSRFEIIHKCITFSHFSNVSWCMNWLMFALLCTMLGFTFSCVQNPGINKIGLNSQFQQADGFDVK